MGLRDRVRAIYADARDAERERDRRIQEAIPIGKFVNYRKGYHLVEVVVLGHSGDRLFVESLSSGKEYWISAFLVDSHCSEHNIAH